MPRKPAPAKLSQALKRHEAPLLKKSHVVGVGIGEKITACNPIEEVFARLGVRMGAG